jgi:hypothetical protein
MTSSRKTTKNNKEKNVLIYVGPTVKGLSRYSSFIGGYPEIHNAHKENCPAFTTLFIEPERLIDFEKKLKNPNSAESAFYKNVEKYFSEVK